MVSGLPLYTFCLRILTDRGYQMHRGVKLNGKLLLSYTLIPFFIVTLKR